MTKYQEHDRIIREICVEFEAEHTSDTEDVKKLRFERIVDLMQQVHCIPYKQKSQLGSNFGIISKALQLAKIVYRKQYILLEHNESFNNIMENCCNYISLKFDWDKTLNITLAKICTYTVVVSLCCVQLRNDDPMHVPIPNDLLIQSLITLYSFSFRCKIWDNPLKKQWETWQVFTFQN